MSHTPEWREPRFFCRLFIYSTNDTPEWLTYIRSPRLPSVDAVYVFLLSAALFERTQEEGKREGPERHYFLLSASARECHFWSECQQHTQTQRCDYDVKSRAVTNSADAW
jgi:hypothetical protein